jgi:hypothetical protein
MLYVLMLLSFDTALCAIPAGAQPPVVLRGEKVAVEAEYREGRLRERYLAIRDGVWVEVATSVYASDPGRTWSVDRTVENAYYLLATASAVPGQAYRQAVRFHWAQFGRTAQIQAADEQVGTDPRYRKLALWDDWRKTVWEEESPQTWLAVPLPDGSMGGGARTWRWGPGPSVYLSSWFNTLRTSYGMALYARRTSNVKLLKLAEQTVELALKAPALQYMIA